MKLGQNPPSLMIESYREAFKKNGVHPASLGCPKGRQEIRFEAFSRFIKQSSRVLDFGCGFGDLGVFFREKTPSLKVDYSGCDLMPDFLDVAKKNNPSDDLWEIGFGEKIKSNYDTIICSGVFNFLYDSSERSHYKKMTVIISNLYESCNNNLIVDFQSPFVDFKQDNGYHQSIDTISHFVVENLSRRFEIVHSYLPYEYCLVIQKKASINRQFNIFED